MPKSWPRHTAPHFSYTGKSFGNNGKHFGDCSNLLPWKIQAWVWSINCCHFSEEKKCGVHSVSYRLEFKIGESKKFLDNKNRSKTALAQRIVKTLSVISDGFYDHISEILLSYVCVSLLSFSWLLHVLVSTVPYPSLGDSSTNINIIYFIHQGLCSEILCQILILCTLYQVRTEHPEIDWSG